MGWSRELRCHAVWGGGDSVEKLGLQVGKDSEKKPVRVSLGFENRQAIAIAIIIGDGALCPAIRRRICISFLSQ